MNLILEKQKAEKNALSFDEVNLWKPILHTHPLFWGVTRACWLIIFWHMIDHTLRISFRQEKNTKKYNILTQIFATAPLTAQVMAGNQAVYTEFFLDFLKTYVYEKETGYMYSIYEHARLEPLSF